MLSCPLPRSPLAVALAASLLGGPALAAPVPEPGLVTIERIEVTGQAPVPEKGYLARRSRSATRTDTDLIKVPQSISVVTEELIRDQAMQGMADVVRYVPGIGMAQGEGNRDTPVLRGNSSTADFFVDGIRDDVQYFRDVYNVERVEALKGPNAMIFGRGGSGGVINRVTKQADWSQHRQANLQLGSWDRKRLTGDLGNAISDAAAFRVTALAEDSGSYRDGVEYQRSGINPTLALALGEDTSLSLGYEHFEDERTADRGIPSYLGKPLRTDNSTFFGNAALSQSDASVDSFGAVLDHRFGNGLELRNSTRWASYDKFYQNVFPGAVSGNGSLVAISAYNQDTSRENLFNQTDLTWAWTTGAVEHRLLAGAEFGRQETDNLRLTGYFTSIGANTTSVQVPVTAPETNLPITFRPSASDANNSGVAKVAAAYIQDQMQLSEHWQAILGLRFDRFKVDFRNNRNGDRLRSEDDLLSPRVGLVYQPSEDVSLYASHSLAYLPRAGEQLASLTLGNQALEPEKFDNLEVGAKWQLAPEVMATAAVYRSDRSNVAVSQIDPISGLPVTVLVDGQRVQGLELGINGQVGERWRFAGGYAWQDGEITRTQSASAPAGNVLPQLPRHSASFWARHDFSARWGVGLGAVYRSAVYASTDNLVELPGYTRLDGAIYLTINPNLKLQLNAENLGNRRYYASAHNNNNITPGGPRAAWLSLTVGY